MHKTSDSQMFKILWQNETRARFRQFVMFRSLSYNFIFQLMNYGWQTAIKVWNDRLCVVCSESSRQVLSGQYTSMCKRELHSSVSYVRKDILMFLLILQIFTFAGKQLLLHIPHCLLIRSLDLSGFICCLNSKRVPFHYLLLIRERNKQIRY